jgi:hypothetical protein
VCVCVCMRACVYVCVCNSVGACCGVHLRPFVSSTIIGATSVEQLKENAAAFAIDWTPEMEKDVDAVFRVFKDPAKNP